MTTPTTDPPVRVPVTARIDADLHAALTEAADAADRSTNSAMNEAIRYWLEKRDADTARLDRPDAPPLVELRPMTEPGAFRVAVDGYPVPHLKAYRSDPPEGHTSTSNDALGWHTLNLAGRFQTKAMAWGELWTTAWFLANAMAVAAGYSCHGPDATKVNPYGPNGPIDDLATWAEHGWAGALGSGRTYEVTLAFRLPAMNDGDLQCYTLRELFVDLLDKAGARGVVTRLVALAPLQESTPVGDPAARAPSTRVDGSANTC